MSYNKNSLLCDITLTAVGAGTVNQTSFDATMADDLIGGAAISAIAGTLDIKLQWSPDRHKVADDASATWFDVPSGAFTQINATGNTSKAWTSPTGRWCRLVTTVVTGPVTGRIYIEGARRS